MKSDESRQRFVWYGVKSISGEVMEVFKLIDLFMFATLDEIERSFLSFVRSLVDMRVLCIRMNDVGNLSSGRVRFDLGSSGFLRFVETRWISNDE